MLAIRFQRAGRKKLPFYRIVVAESTAPVKGRFIEKLGHYNSLSQPKEVKLITERIEYWISVGAVPSQTAARLFMSNGIKSAEKYIKTRTQKPSNAAIKAAEAAKKAEEEKLAAAEAAAAEAAAAAAAEAEEAASESEVAEAPAVEESAAPAEQSEPAETSSESEEK